MMFVYNLSQVGKYGALCSSLSQTRTWAFLPQSSGGMGKNYTQVDVQEKEKREGAGGNVAGLMFINMNKP